MKLTTIILLSACLTASAKGYSQKVSLSEREVPLEKIFKEIKKQTGFSFFFNEDLLAKATKVTVKVKDVSLQEALEICFKGQPLSYSIVGKTVVIEEKKAVSEDETINLPPSPIDVRGRVINEKGEPVAASIIIKGTQQGVSTNADGYFELKGVNANATLVISGVGIEKFEIKVAGRTDLATLNAKTKVSPLDELQIIGYGQTTRRFQTGSVSTIKSEEIEKQPIMNVLSAIQGQVPGVVIDQADGAPGAGIRIQIRGQNTLYSGSGLRPFDQPLIIIDGIPYAPQNNNIASNYFKFGGFSIYVSGSGVSPFNSLNPADIESISFLKDADATSIYGSQALNGVMLITTKKGKVGKTSFNINVYTAPEKATRVTKMLNTQQYLALRKEAVANDGIAPNIFFHPDLLVFDSTKYTDWFKKFYGGTANNTTINASLSGGVTGTTYIVSAGYTKSTYNFPGNFKNERATLHTSFSHKPIGSRLSVDFGTDFSYNKDNSAGAFTLPLGSAMAMPPNLPDMLNPDGSLVWNYRGLDFYFQMENYLRQPSETKNLNLNSYLKLAYQVLPGLQISNNVGYSYYFSNVDQAIPGYTWPPTNGIKGIAVFHDNRYQTLNIEPQAEYQKTISKGRLTLLAGATYKRQTDNVESIFGTNYPNDALLGSPSAAGSVNVSGSEKIYKYAAIFGRANYVYDKKYIINLTGRRDGSSNFGPDRQFGNFGSAGLGWIFSEEPFFRKALPFINFAKFSGNYGTVGSDGISPYLYQDYWVRSTNNLPFQGAVPYQPNNLLNPDYSWGTKKMWNAALDLSFFESRINLSTTWYRNRTSNQLTNTSLPTQTGFASVLQNLDATVQNIGWEFAVSSENIKNKNFTWTSGFNISINRNKLIEYKNLETSPNRNIYVIGKSTNTIQLFQYKGVNDTTGVFEFYKADGKTATFTPTEQGGFGVPHDRVASVDLQPKFTGGLSNSITYKGFELTFLFQFAKQMGYNHLYGIYLGDFISNKPEEILNLSRWQKPGDKAELQKLTSNFGTPAAKAINYFRSSTGVYEDISYVRLKNLSLSYTLPESWLKKVRINNCHVYINAQNLLTITGYKIGDPEMPGELYAIPPQRTIASGISLTF